MDCQVLDPKTKKVLTDLPTPRLLQQAQESPEGTRHKVRLLPSGSKAIAYLADGSEPESAKAFPVREVLVTYQASWG